MEADVKYRIVKSGKNYAIQRGSKKYFHEYKNFKEGFWGKPIKDSAYSFGNFQWRFLEPRGIWEPEDEDIKYVGLQRLHLFDCRYTRIYKTKKTAQDALKQHLWDTKVEPIDGQEEWKQINKD